MPMMGISQPLLSLTVFVSKLNGLVMSFSFLSLFSSYSEDSSFTGSSVTQVLASAVQPPATMPIRANVIASVFISSMFVLQK